MKDLISFHDTSRVWIYQSDRDFLDAEVEEIKRHIGHFCTVWTSHNRALRATGGVLHKRFVVLVVDESHAEASGCSIDQSLAFIKSLEQQYQVNLLDRLQFAYLDNDVVHTIHRDDLSEFLLSGKINGDTLFFNNLVNTKRAFLDEWVVPLKDSWIKRFVKIRGSLKE